MTRISSCFAAGALFISGILAGVYLQHRWPVGLWGRPSAPPPVPATLSIEAISSLPPARRLVIVVAGQSNAANYGSARADGGPGVYAWDQGRLFQARDPLPGADRDRGSPWPRLGASLLLAGDFDAVIFASLAQGSSRADDWAPSGHLHTKLQTTLRELSSAGLPADFILWQQGETEGGSPDESGTTYLAAMTALIASTRDTAPAARWVIARATYREGIAVNAQIREAQRLASALPGALAGPDLDELGPAYRSDGIHFNAGGLDATAALWREALTPALPSRHAVANAP
jgi:hypothetical protein